jgi:hypothetical protein
MGVPLYRILTQNYKTKYGNHNFKVKQLFTQIKNIQHPINFRHVLNHWNFKEIVISVYNLKALDFSDAKS